MISFQNKMEKWLTLPSKFQPLLCTHITRKIKKNIAKKVVLYKTRGNLGGSIVCHLGELHFKNSAKGNIINYLKF